MGDDGLTLERLRRCEFPILAMYGDHSQARLTGAELLEVWPHAIFRRVRDAGHFFPTSRPEEVMSGCDRFWGGDFGADGRRRRAGEAGRRHFRSDRVFSRPGAGTSAPARNRVGPFAASDEARAETGRFIESVAAVPEHGYGANRLGIHPGLSERDFSSDRPGRFRRREERVRAFDGLVWRPPVRRHHARQLPVHEVAPVARHGRLAGGVPGGPVRARHGGRDLALRPGRTTGSGSTSRRRSSAATASRSRERSATAACGVRRPVRRAPALFVSTWSPARGPGPLMLRSEDGRTFDADLRARSRRPAGDDDPLRRVVQGPAVHDAGRFARGQPQRLRPCPSSTRAPIRPTDSGNRSATSASATGNKSIHEMCAFGDHLYVGTLQS